MAQLPPQLSVYSRMSCHGRVWVPLPPVVTDHACFSWGQHLISRVLLLGKCPANLHTTSPSRVRPKTWPTHPTRKKVSKEMPRVGLSEDCWRWYSVSLVSTDFRHELRVRCYSTTESLTDGWYFKHNLNFLLGFFLTSPSVMLLWSFSELQLALSRCPSPAEKSRGEEISVLKS